MSTFIDPTVVVLPQMMIFTTMSVWVGVETGYGRRE
jgi:hypothetical protein